MEVWSDGRISYERHDGGVRLLLLKGAVVMAGKSFEQIDRYAKAEFFSPITPGWPFEDAASTGDES